MGKKRMDTCLTVSLCCTLETNTLWVNYIPIKSFKTISVKEILQMWEGNSKRTRLELDMEPEDIYDWPAAISW